MPPDIVRCREAAQRRLDENLTRENLSSDEAKFRFACHNIGTLGEYAICKHYSCAWSGEYFEGESWNTRAWDTEVGEVRATFKANKEGGMRFYPSDDRPLAPYIWVDLRKFYGSSIIQAKISGWAYQSDNLKLPEWWHPEIGKKGAWILPKNRLRIMGTLPTQI